MNNPFTLGFGKEPFYNIEQTMLENEILETFLSDNPTTQAYMITGLRGSGKTVLMTRIEKRLRENSDWIVVDVNPEQNVMEEIVAYLSNWHTLVQDASVSLSAMGIGVNMKQRTTDSIVLDNLLQNLTKKKKKVLIALDEAVVSPQVKEFVSAFQIYIRKNYNIFLLMTGLYENIYELQNEKTLTFLYRTPKILMKPLNLDRIAASYGEVFQLSEGAAYEMAKVTGGYPFAYQLLGYLCFRNGKSYKEILSEYDSLLSEYVYDKIWSELSEKDRMVISGIAKAKTSKNKDIREQIGMDSNTFTVYRERLAKKGLIDTKEYGNIKLTLPRFKEFSRRKMLVED